MSVVCALTPSGGTYCVNFQGALSSVRIFYGLKYEERGKLQWSGVPNAIFDILRVSLALILLSVNVYCCGNNSTTDRPITL
jgi:hypothetical protein